MTNTVAIVSYNLANGVTKEAFLAANVAMDLWISAQPGFQYRSLSQCDDGSWQDIAYWASKEDALAEDAKFRAEFLSSDFAMMINPNSVKMGYSEVAAQLMAEQAA